MSQVVRIHSFGEPEVLKLDEVDVGTPAPREVLINVGAIGLNRVEALYRAGGFGPVTFPARIGYEAAGVIEAVGSEVEQWAPGDRVAALYGLSMEAYGTYGKKILYPDNMLVTVPKEQTLTEAAASWMMFGTAYSLIDVAKITAGDAVVINAASSSVGIAAIQIAKDHGAIPIAVTRGQAKVAALKEHGAAYVIVSDEEDVSSRVMEITEGRGARIGFDAVAGQPLDRLLDAIAPQGIVIIYGMLAGHSLELMLPKLMMKNLTLRGFSADLLIQQRETRAKVVDYVSSGLRRGALKPVIDRTFDLSEIAAAHRYLEGGTQFGKIVVTTGTAND